MTGPSGATPNAAALSWQACISVQAPISTISADSSATGMKSAGADITPPGESQRSSASWPTTVPSSSRTIGWNASRSWPSDSARSSAAAVRRRSRACRRRRVSNTSTRPRPSALAR